MGGRTPLGRLALALLATGVLGLLLLAWVIPYGSYVPFLAVVAAVAIPGLVYLAWNIEPAWLLTAAVLLSSFNANWGAFGFPGGFAPDRLLLLSGLLGLLLHSSGVRHRPPIELHWRHLVLLATLIFATGSAVAVETVTESDTYFELLDRMAVPFAVFLVAPAAFYAERHRRALLAAFVTFGAYLGLTALFETVGPRALVLPSFILDPSFGFHGGRARGPFLEAAINGIGLYVCAVAAGIALATWRGRWARIGAGCVIALCTLGILFTLTRAVWVGAVVATIVTLVATRELRRFIVPAAAVIPAAVLLALAVVPGFDARFSERRGAELSVWERENVNAAAVAMVSERPLIGFGMGRFQARNSEYFPLLETTPQVAEQRLGVHNVLLGLATDIGLVGAGLFALSLALAVGAGLLTRGPPELRPWRVGLLAIAICWLVVGSFAPIGHVFPSLICWFWAGVVVGGSTGPPAALRL